ncbi:MAG: DUF192 domain-containing protein [Burkholderiaceae bacterium]|jgi:uncharacterized membrane protein (UPF0127 family)|nr:DUF192 domain-containing protein [Burkholderiaceae bacterium]
MPARRFALTHWIAALALAASGALALAQQLPANDGSSPQLNLPRTQITVGMHRIDAQVAATPEQRQTGLMHRTQMPQHEGMLFIFEQPATQCFWMRNTLIALTAAFVQDDGVIANLQDMTPLSEAPHCSAKPVRYVLEMNQGWFASRHIQAGHKLGGKIFQRK